MSPHRDIWAIWPSRRAIGMHGVQPDDPGALAKTGTGAPTPGLPEPWPGTRPVPLNSDWKGKPPRAQQTPRPGPLGVQQAGAWDRLLQGLVGGAGAPEPEQAGEAFPGPVDFQARAT
ncbi:hypothetical protein NDU88_003927 [Pleurodeles waltl]|uniref:Uncharacterized protein n=1 Tax=Pleurodeles waltl TaxID=8319 RepID=A0AAV7UHN0_PLEWA|nr:hypothetical protein NDU88_003927 [Pleurodeles waltl]